MSDPNQTSADLSPELPLTNLLLANPPALEPTPDTESTPLLGHLAVDGAKLLPVCIETRTLFARYAKAYPSQLADLSFTNNFIWFSYMSGFYQRIHDCFCLFSLRGNRLGMLLPPIGPSDQQLTALERCFELMDAYNPLAEFSQVEFVDAALAARLDPGRWQLDPLYPDYLYHTQELIDLAGNPYKTKRNEINQFPRAHPAHAIEPLTRAPHDEVRALLARWLQRRVTTLASDEVTSFLATAEMERLGIERALHFYTELGLSGLVLRIQDQVEGFTFGERLNQDTASILVEKTNVEIPGAAQFLFREFARTFADCTYINVGDDLGLPNLRRVKLSYRPVGYAEKFSLRRHLGR